MNTHLPTAKNNKPGFRILKAMLFLTNLAAITIYFFLRIIFSDFTISLKEDAYNLLRTLGTATAIGAGLYFLYAAMVMTDRLWQKRAVSSEKNGLVITMVKKKEFGNMMLPA